MEIVRIFSNTPKYTLQRKKLLSKHGISVPIEKFVLAFANLGVDGGMYRLRTNIQGENSGLIRQRLTLPLHSIEGNVRRAKSGRSRYQPSEWTQRERERDAGGNYARYIFPPSRVIGIPEAHASHAPPRRADNLCFGTGMIRFATTSPVVVVQM